MAEYSETMKCMNCSGNVVIKQSSSEITPSGRCDNCKIYWAMIYYLSGDFTLYEITLTGA